MSKVHRDVVGGQESNFVDFLAHNGKSERYSYGDSGIVFV